MQPRDLQNIIKIIQNKLKIELKSIENDLLLWATQACYTNFGKETF